MENLLSKKEQRILKSKLSKFSVRELNQIYDNLNHLKWDERLGSKPKMWDCVNSPGEDLSESSWKEFNRKYPIIRPIMKLIDEEILEEEIFGKRYKGSVRLAIFSLILAIFSLVIVIITNLNELMPL